MSSYFRERPILLSFSLFTNLLCSCSHEHWIKKNVLCMDTTREKKAWKPHIIKTTWTCDLLRQAYFSTLVSAVVFSFIIYFISGRYNLNCKFRDAYEQRICSSVLRKEAPRNVRTWESNFATALVHHSCQQCCDFLPQRSRNYDNTQKKW